MKRILKNLHHVFRKKKRYMLLKETEWNQNILSWTYHSPAKSKLNWENEIRRGSILSQILFSRRTAKKHYLRFKIVCIKIFKKRINLCFFTFFFIKRSKNSFQKKIRFPGIAEFASFGMSWIRLGYFYKMSVYLFVFDKNFVASVTRKQIHKISCNFIFNYALAWIDIYKLLVTIIQQQLLSFGFPEFWGKTNFCLCCIESHKILHAKYTK